MKEFIQNLEKLFEQESEENALKLTKENLEKLLEIRDNDDEGDLVKIGKLQDLLCYQVEVYLENIQNEVEKARAIQEAFQKLDEQIDEETYY